MHLLVAAVNYWVNHTSHFQPRQLPAPTSRHPGPRMGQFLLKAETIPTSDERGRVNKNTLILSTFEWILREETKFAAMHFSFTLSSQLCFPQYSWLLRGSIDRLAPTFFPRREPGKRLEKQTHPSSIRHSCQIH